MTTLARRLAAALLATALAAPALAAPAPQLSLKAYDQLRTPLPYPYDEAADGVKAVDAARARARAEHKLLLIDLGGNWCGDCRVLAGTVEQTELGRFVRDHYVLVPVDIGRRDKNLAVPARYGLKVEGVPALLVVDPRTDRLLNAGHVADLSDARHMSPQGLADYLARWTG
jgi:thiol:disulfide interchange protein